ncbi:tRNA wybutosine-synthesizing protein 3 [Marchantia polymorpha subsp. ruderalis]|uniref:SAM-dependent methyltransferase TRM5/TYW2-type domain-containing protein n=1 Tax=Marchantia polymorpha TaxID=3197 RepID=A0A2R6W738_MARPO|nr:hypothetical protein MARPO_0137s0034 [Marchantia polymorpha]BBN02828.1 hypothetical protein Mp_2g18470 [Marchantia polymorpha subsp. ruderalis]|eukprot:PTQ29667.1 hypothetical protein MARPO_0137s0034 [Marchantia polymorpha]
MVAHKEFELRKQAVLRGLASDEVDKSRKGGVDAPIADLIRRINSHPEFYTTSSCSGRVSLFLDQPCAAPLGDDVPDSSKEKVKKGGDWIFVSHEAAAEDDVVNAVNQRYAAHQKGLLVFRFEPFILALECSSLAASQQLVTCAMASGFRESGITSAGKRFILAVRCSIRMEVPIADEGELLVTEEYLRYLTRLANKKMVLNQQRIDRFLSTFTATVEGGLSSQSVQVPSSRRKAASGFAGLRKRQKMFSEVADKLLSSLEKRQQSVLSRIGLLESKSGCTLISEVQDDERYQQSAGSRESYFSTTFVVQRMTDANRTPPVEVSSQRPGLCAASFVISGEPPEKLFRWGHSTCALGDQESGCNSVLIYGGYGGPERHARQNDLLMLDVQEGSLRSLQTVGSPAPIMAHTASRVKDTMVVIGGRRDPSCVLNGVSVLDLKTFEWETPVVTGVEFPPRHRHSSAVMGSRIFVYGGLNGSQPLSDLHMLDTSSWTWSLITCGGEHPSARHSHSLAAAGGKLFLFGGREGNKVYGDLYVLDLGTLRWNLVKAGGRPPSPRFSHTMTVVGDRHIAVSGGCPITKDKDLVLLDTSTLMWARNQVDWPREALLVRHTTTLVDDTLITIGGGAACFAFGTHFSPPLKLSLKPFVHSDPSLGKKLQRETERPSHVEKEDEDRKLLSWILKVDSRVAKQAKDALKKLAWLDLRRKSKVSEQRNHVAFPIIESAASFLSTHIKAGQPSMSDEVPSSYPEVCNHQLNEVENNDLENQALRTLAACGGEVLKAEMPLLAKQCCSPFASMEGAVSAVLEQNHLPKSLLQELPKKWERLGDLVVLPAGSLTSSVWSSLGEQVWRAIAMSLSANRLARQASVAATGTRDSQLQLLHGTSGWVEHKENGIVYCFDATKCMFSSGNVSEKLRIASMQCRGATVVDLFAGIGYYVLPFLIKAGARHVYACEWNPHALAALRHNLRVNGVEDSCSVLEGDNRCSAPEGVADIVSLGLLPSSEAYWLTAVAALRPEGGLLLVHENVKDSEEEKWTEHLLMSIRSLATSIGRVWTVSLVHLERVKWYAPHIRHVVADVLCKQYDG